MHHDLGMALTKSYLKIKSGGVIPNPNKVIESLGFISYITTDPFWKLIILDGFPKIDEVPIKKSACKIFIFHNLLWIVTVLTCLILYIQVM